MMSLLLPAAIFAAIVRAQSACTLTTETHPSMSWQECTSSGCSSVSGKLVIDSNWRWTHEVDGSTNCYEGNEWDTSICPDNDACTEACCVDGADYGTTYGVSAGSDSLSLTFVTTHEYGTNIGSRLYLMADDESYQMFTLLGKEFTFDVDVSALPCGLNGALYFVSMAEDGGSGEFSTNTAGAAYGAGYCDSQCPRDLKFVGGVANVEDWTASTNDENAGVGGNGACCAEMDIWEANSQATAYTPHTCDDNTYHVCSGDSCGGTYSAERYAGDCDPDGCDFNSYRQGNTTFYGEGSGFVVDTTQTMTVVTQFIEEGGELSEIRRLYVQGGTVIENSESLIEGTSGNSINEEFCAAAREAFGDRDTFNEHGGMSQMSAALSEPMVLVMSLWDDHYANMLWLDSTYPVDSTSLGAERGPCPTDSGVPADVESENADSKVIFSNIRFGDIDTTYGEGTGSDGGDSDGGDDGGDSSGDVPQWGQCGGNNYSGSTSCASGYTCVYVNEWYSQCQ